MTSGYPGYPVVVIQVIAKISVALEVQLKVSSIGSMITLITLAVVCLEDEAILLCVLRYLSRCVRNCMCLSQGSLP
jgi:hypothetical protein